MTEMKKTAVNSMKLIFDSDSRNEAFARCTVTSFVSRLDPSTDELADIRTAVSEAVTNSIIHGYKGKTGEVKVEAVLYSDRSVKITVTDKGCGIENVEMARQPLFTTDESGERGGMGFAIMESFSDSFKVRSEVGKGTKISMIKRLK
jgi:stage II sporulation protein AB (anti-sigma F factor)